MRCPKCNVTEGFADVELHGIKAKVCSCGAIMIVAITEEYDRYFAEEQARRKRQEKRSTEECPECYFYMEQHN